MSAVKDMDLLARVLAARERRAALRLAACAAFGDAFAIGELGLNVPGWPKLGRVWFVPFVRGLRALAPEIELRALIADDAGYWALLRGPGSPRAHKHRCCVIEEAAPWGRLLDFDWYAGGRKIDREQLGLEARRCWVCGGDPQDCLFELRHDLEQSRARARQLARSSRRSR
ncbi:MAG: citrate lyase holo-[acyl-carrier protein] synthase [Myxococcales bacterium]|nr:citrate lyase holo-[acyl-carrier protein] synthase [Myxococcales bacterium]